MIIPILPGQCHAGLYILHTFGHTAVNPLLVIGKQKRKLITAEAVHIAPGPNPAQEPAHFLQELIPSVLSAYIVDLAEIPDGDNHKHKIFLRMLF